MNCSVWPDHFFTRLKALLLVFILTFASAVRAERPVLVVVVSVDQLAYEYLERFHENFPQDGFFRRCETQGAWFTNCQHRHAFTYTAPGHAVQLTGCYPSEHGIIDNDWFDRVLNRKVYCVWDEKAKLIGLSQGKDKPVSPRSLLAETVGDRLKLASHGRSKVFGVAIKDRASILMCGRLADAAIWMSDQGEWITTDYYRQDLPGSARLLNASGHVKAYGGQEWTFAHDRQKYQHGPTEDSFGEKPPYGVKPNFPHVLDEADGDFYIKQLAGSPYGNAVTLHAALKVLETEEMGVDKDPDLLCVNLSSNDYVGHSFGPDSLEVEDMTYHTDLQLANFFTHIEEHLAGKPWIMAVTADHAVGPIPERIKKLKRAPAERNPFGEADRETSKYLGLQKQLEARLRKRLALTEELATPLVQGLFDNEVYFHRDHAELQGERFEKAQLIARDFMLEQPAVAAALTREQLIAGQVNTKVEKMIRAGFHPQRSGDVLFVLHPYIIHGPAPATHGSPWQYDTHVPLLLLEGGKSQTKLITPGKYHRDTSPAMLAPTLSKILGINSPAQCVEQAITEILPR